MMFAFFLCNVSYAVHVHLQLVTSKRPGDAEKILIYLCMDKESFSVLLVHLG